MKRCTLLLIIMAGSLMILNGQDRNFKRIFLEAEYFTLAGDYEPALRHYENLLSIDPNNANINFLCGYSYLKSGGNIDRVITLFEKAIENVDQSYKDGSYKERNAPLDAIFLLGRAYHIDNRFEDAIASYTDYSNRIDKNDFAEVEYVNAHIKACELGKSMMDNPVDVEFKPLKGEIDYNWDLYNPVVSGNDSVLIFISDRNNRFNIMMSEKENGAWSKPQGIDPQIALTGNLYPVSLSYDGTELYIAYNDYFNMDIYVSHWENGRWTNAVKLDKNINTKYTESHATLSKDGSRLYFTSDRKGGIGGLDIYVSERISGDKWGDAVNLGHSVNTYYNEDCPFLTRDDRMLFFSSQGHNTMGGYDIFYSNLTPEGEWEAPSNLGFPVNSTADDLFFNPGWESGQALYARVASEGDAVKEIYRVDLPLLAPLYAQAGDSAAAGATDSIPAEGEKLAMREEGPAIDEEEPAMGKEEQTTGEKRGSGSESGEIPDGEASGTNKETPRKAPTFSSLGIYYILNNILFNYNEASINADAVRDVERLYILMRKYPEIGVELTGHTDAVGSKEYNLRLSNRRAQSVANFLVSKGINPERISVNAAGEANPVAINRYEDGSDAPEGRKLNRHVSIKITNLSTDKIRVADMFVPDDLIPNEDKGYTVLLFQSNGRVAHTPEEFLNEQISMISTDNSYLYTAGQFDRKREAVAYLNEVIDRGYPDARIMERRSLETLIQDNSASDRFDPQAYTIQIMALQKPRDVAYFKDLSDMKRYDCKDGLYRFVTGEYDRIEDALKELPRIKAKGYKDAMIMPCSRYLTMVR